MSGRLVRVDTPAAEVAVEARLRGATVGLVGPAGEQGALLAGIARALRFPGWFGRNLDALEECLRDLSWLAAGEVVLVWQGDAVLRHRDPTAHRVLLELLADAVADTAGSARPLRVVLAGVDPPG